jgi:hypothetical protein
MIMDRRQTLFRAVLGIGAAILLSAVAHADWFPETRLTVASGASYLSGNNANCLVTDSGGDLHLVWYDYCDGDAEIHYKRFNGVDWSPEATLTSSDYSSEFPSLAAGGAGTLHLVWSRYEEGGGRIHYRHFNGTTWDPSEVVTDFASATERPTVAVDDTGLVHVVWREYGSGAWHIYHKTYDGVVWSGAGALSDAAGYPRYASIAAGENGEMHVAWDDYRHGNWEIYYRLYDGSAWQAEELLTSDAGASESPAILIDSDGKVHVFWDDDRAGYATIYHKVNDGMGWGLDEPVVVPDEFAIEPYAVPGDSGRIHLAWYDEAGYSKEVYYQEYDGASWLERERISFNNDVSRRPAIAVGGDGVVHAVWHDDRKGNYEIYWRAKRDIPKPEVTSITPDSEYAYQSVHITDLAGTGFFSGAEVRLQKAGEDDILATNVVAESDTRITCDFELGVEGYWDVVVENLDQQADTLTEGFYAVPLPKPDITSIIPLSEYAYQDVHIADLSGTGFFPEAEVWLQKAGEGDIMAINVTVESNIRITCDFKLGVEGFWDVVVRNVDGKSDTLVAGFYVIPLPKPEIVSIEPDSQYAYQDVHITDISGTGFFPDAEVWLQKTGEDDIVASNVVAETSTRITCDFSLSVSGYWDLVVRNVDGKSDTLASAFYVIPLPPPQLVSITPMAGRAYESIYISDLSGSNLFQGAEVRLQRVGESVYAEDVVAVSTEQVTCGFGLGDAAVGMWDVILENVDGATAALQGAFEVMESLWGNGVRLTFEGSYSSTSKPNARCIALDSMGEPHIVWYDNRTGDCEIYYNSRAGGTWGPGEKLTASSGTAEFPAIALDSNDHVHVVWSDDRNGAWDIYYKVNDGAGWGSDTRLTDGSGQSRHPSIAVDGEDHLHLVWQNDHSGSPKIFYGSNDGSGWTLAGCIAPYISGSATPAIAADGFNHIHIAWYRDSGSDDHLYYKCYDGSVWGETVDLAARRSVYGPAIAVDSRNMVHVAWHDARYGGSEYEIFSRRFDGFIWDPEIRITEASLNSSNAALTADDNGNTYLMWADERSGVTKIYYAKHDGEGWGGDVLLVEAAVEGRHPSVASTPEGDLHLIWRDERDGNPEIYYKSRAADMLAGVEADEPQTMPVASLGVMPNPVRRGAEIRFHLAKEASADLAVYDVTGRLVSRKVLGDLTPGSHRVSWDMTDLSGNRVAPGVYMVSITVGQETRSAKIVVLR